MSVKAYFVTQSYKSFVKEKEFVREFLGNDYGLAEHDSLIKGQPYKAVTKSRDGYGSFFIMPEEYLALTTEH